MLNKINISTVVLCLFVVLNSLSVFAQPSSGYYSSVDDSSPQALKSSLHNIIKDHTRFPYTSSATDTWDVLELAGEDVDNNSRIIALYKNSDYVKVGGGNNDYNREHSWPKSYGFPNDGSSNYPYTDMHHLFLANSSYNSSRSNKPYDICTSGCTEKPTDVNNGRGGSGQSNFTATDVWDVWQERQGDVARAMFYMAVRYEGGNHGITGHAEPDLELTDNLNLIEASATGSNESQAYMGLLSVLITWHYSDPVDIYEHQHNESVASAQGNRNPFIDNPDWVECVFELVCNGNGGGDTTAPNAPNSLTGSVSSSAVTLDWFNNTESDLAGYNVYRSTGGGGFVKLNNSLVSASAYVDNTVSASTTYLFKVTAQDNSGNESSFGSQISLTTSSGGNNGGGNELSNGSALSGLSGNTNSENFYTMSVPAGASNLSFSINGGSGDVDLYVKFGSAPSSSDYDCRPYLNGNNESCNIGTAQSGTYYVMLRGYTAYSGVSLTGVYSADNGGGGSQDALFSSGTNRTIPDNNSSGVSSDVSVNRTGSSNTVRISYDIVHTYQGDLTVQLIDPTGVVTTLRGRSGGGTNDINESKTIDKGSTSANGTWSLKVIDSAAVDTGYIDFWSIEFL